MWTIVSPCPEATEMFLDRALAGSGVAGVVAGAGASSSAAAMAPERGGGSGGGEAGGAAYELPLFEAPRAWTGRGHGGESDEEVGMCRLNPVVTRVESACVGS